MGSYSRPPKTFLFFSELERKPGQTTDRWEIKSHHSSVLGYVRFYPGWRCYAAEPSERTIWSWDCALELSNFLKARTDEWRESKRKKKPAGNAHETLG